MMEIRKKLLLALGASALLASLSSVAPAQARTTGACSGKATAAEAKKAPPAKGVAWQMTSDEKKPISCFYKAAKGDHGYVLTSLNAWTIKVNDKVVKSGKNVLDQKGSAVNQGSVPKVAEGSIIEITVIPGCRGSQCGAAITLAMGAR